MNKVIVRGEVVTLELSLDVAQALACALDGVVDRGPDELLFHLSTSLERAGLIKGYSTHVERTGDEDPEIGDIYVVEPNG